MRAEALEWWKSLNSFEKETCVEEWKLVSKDLRKSWPIELISASSSVIEQIYREIIWSKNFDN